jgi:iron complex transport system substrate-binding protein
MKTINKIIAGIYIVTLTLFLFSCTNASTNYADNISNIIVPAENSENKVIKSPEIHTIFPLTIKDSANRQITIQKTPQRIISLAPGITETLFALGTDDRIIGDTNYCDYPEAAKLITKIGSFTTPNLEKIVSLEPDLILAETIHLKTVVPALDNLGLTVVVLATASVENIFQNMILIGQICDLNNNAANLKNDLTGKLNAISLKTSSLSMAEKPRVFYTFWYQPIWTMGAKTYVNELIQIAGGSNIFAPQIDDKSTVSLESIIAANPQIIITSSMGTNGEVIYNSFKNEERLKSTEAIINNRIFRITDPNIIERPGPRIIYGVQELLKLFHPDIFEKIK